MKNKIDKIGNIIIVISIILANIFIGSNIKEPIWIIQTIITIFTVIYIITNIIIREKNIITKSKIDIFVLIFMISTTLPYILKTYVSFDGTINFIFKYWSIYSFYILARNVIIEEKQVKLIIKTVIISSLIPIIFGWDKLLNFNIFKSFLGSINSVNIEDARMVSTFGYANTFAAYLSLTIVIAIYSFKNNNNKKIKILYGIYIIITLITIILTQSKFVIALLVLVGIIYVSKLIVDKKISNKTIIIGVLLILTFFIYVAISVQISKPLEITQKDKTCVIRGIEAETEYKFTLDIDAQTNKEYNVFEISIVGINRYFAEKTLARVGFSEFKGTKDIIFTTNEEIQTIEIRIKNECNGKIIINNFKINDNNYILEYKYIPHALVRMFTTFNFKNSSVWQRADYWKDGLNIIQQKGLIGAGGNTWRILYGQVQDYLYYAKESHCYLLEVWMSFGVIGIISFIGILILIFKNMIHSQKENLAISIGLSVIIIHSIMDFDMSYYIIEIMFYLFMSILFRENKEIKSRKTNLLEYPILIVLILIMFGNICGYIASLTNDETYVINNKLAPWISRYQYNRIVYLENNNIEEKEKIDLINDYIEKEPYQNQNVIYEIKVNSILKEESISNQTQTLKESQKLVETWKNVKRERTYLISDIQTRADNMLELAKGLKEEANKSNNKELNNVADSILKILISEYEENKNIILNYNKNNISIGIANIKYNIYNETYNRALKLLNNNS